MTIDEIRTRLHSLHFQGKWSYRALEKETGISATTLRGVHSNDLGKDTIARLKVILPMLGRPPKRKIPHRPSVKRKPGHRKRFLIRYHNLMKWLDIIEQEKGITKRFHRPKEYMATKERIAFACCRLDFQMKSHLLVLFGDRLRQKKIVLGDCFQAERWIEKIKKELPGVSQKLFADITKRYDTATGHRPK